MKVDAYMSDTTPEHGHAFVARASEGRLIPKNAGLEGPRRDQTVWVMEGMV